jgi:hypothetical protein
VQHGDSRAEVIGGEVAVVATVTAAWSPAAGRQRTAADLRTRAGHGHRAPGAHVDDAVGLGRGDAVVVFFAKRLDGRIDDPSARGLWSTNGDRTPWLMQGGKRSRPRAVRIQVRPDPLAR